MRPLLALPLALLALGLVACGSSSSGGSSSSSSGSSSGGSSSSTASGGKATVTIKNFKYMPATLTVKAGTKVTFVNQDSAEHTATAQNQSIFNTGTLNHGQSKTVTVSKAGTYPYSCLFHAFMHGTLVVK